MKIRRQKPEKQYPVFSDEEYVRLIEIFRTDDQMSQSNFNKIMAMLDAHYPIIEALSLKLSPLETVQAAKKMAANRSVIAL